MDMDNSVGIDYGSVRQDGQRRAKRENWDSCNSINNKIFFKSKLLEIWFSILLPVR